MRLEWASSLFTNRRNMSLGFGVLEGLDVGLDRRGPVLWDLYERHGAFPYTGRIHDVHVVPLARAKDV